MSRFHQFRLILGASFCALLWGSAFPAIKGVYATWETNSLELRLCFAGIRFTVAGFLLLPFCWREFQRVKPNAWCLAIGLALGQTFFQYIFFYSGLAVSSGVLGSILVGTGSLWWILLAPVTLKTSPPQARHLWVVALCSLGVFLAAYAPGAGGGSPVWGALFFMLATLAGAVGAIIIVPLARRMDVCLATAFALAVGGVLLLLCGIRSVPMFIENMDARLALITLYLATVSAVAFATWNWLVREYSVNVLAGYRFLIPLSAVTQSTLFIDGESPGVGIFVGGALILGSLVYLHRIESKPN